MHEEEQNDGEQALITQKWPLGNNQAAVPPNQAVPHENTQLPSSQLDGNAEGCKLIVLIQRFGDS